jgi:hypothetical protein
VDHFQNLTEAMVSEDEDESELFPTLQDALKLLKPPSVKNMVEKRQEEEEEEEEEEFSLADALRMPRPVLQTSPIASPVKLNRKTSKPYTSKLWSKAAVAGSETTAEQSRPISPPSLTRRVSKNVGMRIWKRGEDVVAASPPATPPTPTTTTIAEHPRSPSTDMEDEHPGPLLMMCTVSNAPLTRKNSKKFRTRLPSKTLAFPKRIMNSEMKLLNESIANKKSRSKLILALLRLKGDYAVKVRFICAVQDYEQTSDKHQKKTKGEMIIHTFVKPGSMFQMNGIPVP